MDCDDVMLLLAAREQRRLTGLETSKFDTHVSSCDHCQSLATEVNDEDDWRWLVRVPSDALDDENLLVLPVVDPVVFTNEQEIASGGMGRITRAHDRRLGRDVAIKEVLEPDLRARFEREVAITARLQHPAIVPIYEAGTFPNGSTFYTMRLVPGGTLATALDDAKTLRARLALLPHIRAVTDALAYAHSREVIHRDLKPSNVLIGDYGETIVIDWGLAKELGHDDEFPSASALVSNPELTHAGTVIGTPCYMSPEQAAGRDVDERDDVYALGSLLYHLLTGQPPYWDASKKQSAQMIVEATLKGPPQPIEKLAPEVPADLRAIAERAMAREKAQRFPTAKEMAEELHRFEAGQLLKSREYSTRELVARWLRRHRTAVLVGAVTVTALIATAIAAFVNVTRSRADEQVARVTAEESAIKAEHAKAKGEATVLSLLEEQGRTEVLAGERQRGLAYLAEAYSRGHVTPAMRHLLAVATRDLDLQLHGLDVELGGAPDVAVMSDGTIVTYGSAAEITRPPTPRGILALWRDGKIVAKHERWVDLDDVTYDKGATRIAGVIDDKELGVWDVLTGKKLWSESGKYEQAELWFTPSGNLLFQNTEKPVFELRDGETGQRLAASPQPASAYAIAFDRVGALLAVIDSSHVVRVLDARTLKLVASVEVKADPNRVTFLDGRTLVIGTRSPSAHLWKIGEPTSTPTFGGHYGMINEIAASATGDLVATGDSLGTVRLWTDRGILLGESRELRGDVGRLVFSPDGGMLAGSGVDTRVLFWDTTLSLIGSAPAFEMSGYNLRWTPDGAGLVTDDSSAYVARVWARPVGHRIARFPSERVRVTTKHVFVAYEGAIVIRDLVTGAEVSRLTGVLDKDRWPYFEVSRDGTRMLVQDDEKGNVVYDIASQTPLKTIAGKATLSPDGDFVILDEEKRKRIVDAATGQQLVVVSHEWDTPRVAISNDGRRLVGSDTDALRLWDLEALALVPTPMAPHFDAHELAFDHGGTHLIWQSWDEAKVIDVATGALRATFKPRDDSRIRFVRTDHASRRVAIQANLVVTVWNVASQRLLFSVDGVNDDAFAISADGGRLATGNSDGGVRIWDVETGRLLEVLRGHRDRIESIAFSDDGTRLLVASNDKTTTIWDVSLEQRSPMTIRALAERTEWRVADGVLVRKLK